MIIGWRCCCFCAESDHERFGAWIERTCIPVSARECPDVFLGLCMLSRCLLLLFRAVPSARFRSPPSVSTRTVDDAGDPAVAAHRGRDVYVQRLAPRVDAAAADDDPHLPDARAAQERRGCRQGYGAHVSNEMGV